MDEAVQLRRENLALRARVAELERAAAGPEPTDLLRALLANAPDIITTVTPDGRFLSANRIVGTESTEYILGRSVLDYAVPEHRQRVRDCLARVVATGQPDSYESDALTSVGRRSYLVRVIPVRAAGGALLLCLIATDVSRFKDVERSLRESEEALRVAVVGTGIGLWARDAHADRPTWDEAFCRIVGVPAGYQPPGTDTFLQLVHPLDRAAFDRHRQTLCTAGAAEPVECRIVRPSDGAVRWILCFSGVVRDENGGLRKVMGGILDVTERRQMEEKLRQAQRMDALGSMTAGVAHNFNNLLMAVLPSLDTALARAPAELVDSLSIARDATARAAALVRELMLFAGQGRAADRHAQDVVRVVHNAVEICRSTFPRDVRLELTVDAQDACVELHAGSLEQAVMNVCLNARDAVRGRPDAFVGLSVSHVPAGAAELAAAPRPISTGDHVCITVTDNGSGMSEEVQRHAFEPFFTTKPPGRGTGLGLSTAYAIVKEHGGWISCRSAPGGGSTLRIFLPAVPASAVARGEPPPQQTPPVVPTGARILVTDDDGIVRRVVAASLRDAGFDVLEAANGAEAVATYQRELSGAGVRLVLIDDSMPVMSGRQAVERIRRLDPEAICVLLTGYGIDREQAPGCRDVLTKPVTSVELIRCVRRALSAG